MWTVTAYSVVMYMFVFHCYFCVCISLLLSMKQLIEYDGNVEVTNQICTDHENKQVNVIANGKNKLRGKQLFHVKLSGF